MACQWGGEGRPRTIARPCRPPFPLPPSSGRLVPTPPTARGESFRRQGAAGTPLACRRRASANSRLIRTGHVRELEDKERAPGGGGLPRRTAASSDVKSPAFATKDLPAEPTVAAPDGFQVRELLSLHSGSAAHFELPPGAVSLAGRHRTVDEIWYILGGSGEMWRRDGNVEEVVSFKLGLCLTIPVGTAFQFRAIGDEPLSAFAVTMPPWPTVSGDEWLEVEPYWPTWVAMLQGVPGSPLPGLSTSSLHGGDGRSGAKGDPDRLR